MVQKFLEMEDLDYNILCLENLNTTLAEVEVQSNPHKIMVVLHQKEDLESGEMEAEDSHLKLLLTEFLTQDLEGEVMTLVLELVAAMDLTA